LWRHRDFNKLWLGQAVSAVGSQVTLLALPLTAVLYLHATAGQVGLLAAAGLAADSGPSLLFGVMADRMRRRPLMIAADTGRAAVILLIPWSPDRRADDARDVRGGAHPRRPDRYLRGGTAPTYRAWSVPRRCSPGNSRLRPHASIAQVTGPGPSGLRVDLLGARSRCWWTPLFVVSVVSLLGSGPASED
jgi:MFS family permease